MKNILKKLTVLVLAVIVIFPALAQDDKKISFTVQGDLVSSYVWRGTYNAGASLQPALGMNIGGFSLTAWGSKEISGPHKEIDLTVAWSLDNLTLSVSDYWWDGEKQNSRLENNNNRYFHFNNHNTSHYLEAGIGYTISEKFPLSAAWNIMFWGADKKADGGQNYSSYVELNYPFTVGNIDLQATLGASPYDSGLYDVSRFAVCDLGLSASKQIKISNSFSLSVFTKLIFDPAHEDTHLVFGLTL